MHMFHTSFSLSRLSGDRVDGITWPKFSPVSPHLPWWAVLHFYLRFWWAHKAKARPILTVHTRVTCAAEVRGREQLNQKLAEEGDQLFDGSPPDESRCLRVLWVFGSSRCFTHLPRSPLENLKYFNILKIDTTISFSISN